MSKLIFFADNTLTSTKEFTLEELFDVRINRIWEFANDQRVPSKIYHKVYHQLYTKENVYNLTYQLIYGLSDWLERNSLDLFKSNFLEYISPEYFWLFQYAYVRECTSIAGDFTVQFGFPDYGDTWPDRNASGYRASDNTYFRVTKTTVNEKFSEYTQKLKTLFARTEDSNLHRSRVKDGHTSTEIFFKALLFNKLVYANNGNTVPSSALLSLGLETKVSTGHSEEDILRGYSFNLSFKQKVTKTFRDPLYHVLTYSTQATNLIDWPIVDKHEKSPILYGVELECVSDYNVRDIIDAQAIPFFIAKSDGSISGSKRNATELVTVPMSLKAHKKHWAHWFKNIDYRMFDCTKDTSNGMHVHIDRKAFMNDQHIRNMCWFYTHPANAEFLLYISERGSYEKMRQYSPIYQYGSSMSKVRAFKDCVRLSSTIRGIINFNKPATIEVRMFRGIVSFGELIKDIEFVDAIFHFCGGEHSMNKLLFSDFLIWLSREPANRYTVLRKFIDQCKGLPEMMIQAEVKNIIWTLSDPMQIAERLNKSPIKITNAHITILNRGHKRKYTLNKETGLVDINLNNMSKFYKIDRDIEARYTREAVA